MTLRKKFVLMLLLGLWGFLPGTSGTAWSLEPADYAMLHLSRPAESTPVTFRLTRALTAAHAWGPGETVLLRAYTRRANGTRVPLRDRQGQTAWPARLDAHGEAFLSFYPASTSFTGALLITGNGRVLLDSNDPETNARAVILEKVYEERFADGAGVRVHFTDQQLENAGTDPRWVREILRSAVTAYETIVHQKGFGAPGYTFAGSDRSYAYDPDRTIAIVIGDPSPDNRLLYHGFSAKDFRNAPFFDTRHVSGREFDAMILLPGDYPRFIQRWGRLNPSPLGHRNPAASLRGTLMHEMLHAVLFYYHQNLTAQPLFFQAQPRPGTQAKPKTPPLVDWYIEGLARYFEFFADSPHDFYSEGFQKRLPDKIQFSRGGVNYYLRFPDQHFTTLRYESALFWYYLDRRFGMPRIEQFSRQLRRAAPDRFLATLEASFGESFEALFRDFSRRIALRDFDLEHLGRVAATRLVLTEKGFFLLDGEDKARFLGLTCDTDWVGRWGSFSAAHGEPGVGGDRTRQADVAGYASDFYEIQISPDSRGSSLSITHRGGEGTLSAELLVLDKSGRTFLHASDTFLAGENRKLRLPGKTGGALTGPDGRQRVLLIVTGGRASEKSRYRLELHENSNL